MFSYALWVPTYQKTCIIEPQVLQRKVYRYIQHRICDASYRLWSKPFPSEVSITEDQVMGDFERLEVFVWLKECLCCKRNDYADENREQNDVHGHFCMLVVVVKA